MSRGSRVKKCDPLSSLSHTHRPTCCVFAAGCDVYSSSDAVSSCQTPVCRVPATPVGPCWSLCPSPVRSVGSLYRSPRPPESSPCPQPLNQINQIELYYGLSNRNRTIGKHSLHCESKKQDTILLSVTSPNVNRFSEFSHR